MDKLKDPAIVVSGLSIGATVVVAYYFYNQMTEMGAEMSMLKAELAALQARVQALEKEENSQKRKLTNIERKQLAVDVMLEESGISSRADDEDSVRSRNPKVVKSRTAVRQLRATTVPSEDEDEDIDFSSMR